MQVRRPIAAASAAPQPLPHFDELERLSQLRGQCSPKQQLLLPAMPADGNERHLPIAINPAPGSGSGVAASEMKNKSVVGTLLRNIVEISEHFATEVRQDESLRLDLCPVPQDVRVVQVESHGFAEEIAFGD